MKIIRALILLVIFLIFWPLPVIASQEKGLEIAMERKARDTGWQDSESNITMKLTNYQGESHLRGLRIKSLEVDGDGDGDKSLTIIDNPADVKGTALLSHFHIAEADDQWLYLPSLKRTKRISSRNKSGPFMGSEFAYEDLSSFEVEKYSYNYLRDDAYDGREVYVMDHYPKDRYSGYTKQTVWLDKENYRPYKVEFYDRKKSLLKTLHFEDYQLYLNRFWRSHKMTMINHQTGNTTELLTHHLEFRRGLREGVFTRSALQRAR